MKRKILLADLTHTASGIFAAAFPLGASLVCSYAQKELGDEFDFKLFKIPDKLIYELSQGPVFLLGLSSYAWNMNINYKVCQFAKRKNPDIIIVFGGPNIPVEFDEKKFFFQAYPLIDFYIENDGEVAFVELVRKILFYNEDIKKFKNALENVPNCAYLSDQQLICGNITYVSDLNIVPSPYLSGLLDEYFEMPMIPLIETTRGCPFNCLYCVDGVKEKSKIRRLPQARIREEIDYISEKIDKINMLMISDLNFGMYKEDLETALHISNVQKQKSWPVMIGTAVGKNNPDIIRKVVALLGDSWRPGASIQSSDKEVLKNIRRDRFDIRNFKELIKLGNALGAHSYSDIILALPGDSKKTHFESLRFCIDSSVSQINLYQAMLLNGAVMSTKEIRAKFKFETRFRVRQGTIGLYRFDSEDVPIFETEEIVVASKDMTFIDYLDCRIMDLIVEIYINSSLFEEVFAALRKMELSVFDVIQELYNNKRVFFSENIKSIFDYYLTAFKDNLYTTREDVIERIAQPGVIELYLDGVIGGNELLDHKAMLYLKLKDVSSALMRAIEMQLQKNGLWSKKVEHYLGQLIEFIICRKTDFRDCNIEHMFYSDYDFVEVSKVDYCIHPKDLPAVAKKIKFKLYHNAAQQKIINNEVDFFKKTTGGMGRLLQQGNLKKMYRIFEKA